jgi:hypothetical protein
MLGRRASLLGELAEPPQLCCSGISSLKFPPNQINSNKKGEAPLFNWPSGFHLWHNLWAVCNEAAAETKGASPMKKRNIYQNQSQELLSLFEERESDVRSHGLCQKGPFSNVLQRTR